MSINLGEVTGSTAALQKKKETTQIANGLDKDAFMKLFLEQLKNQDPTSPMETDKIITQTAQLTQVEMQEENKKTMKEVAQAMKASQKTNESLQDFQKDMKKSLELLNIGMEENTQAANNGAKANSLNAVSMIGKIAETDIMGLNVSGAGQNHFSLYFDNKIDTSKGNPSIEILDSNNEVVRVISLNDKDGMQGYIDFIWDGKDSTGHIVDTGSYKVRAYYNLNPLTKQYDETRIGRGEVQSIIYDNGTPLMRLGDNIVPVENALEFYPKGESANKSVESIKTDASKAMKAYKNNLQTESLSEKYDKIMKERESKLVENQEIDEEDLALKEKEKEEEAKKTLEKQKYEKMLDAAYKGEQLEQKELDKIDNKISNSNNLNPSNNANLDSLSESKPISKSEQSNKDHDEVLQDTLQSLTTESSQQDMQEQNIAAHAMQSNNMQ